jgi:hypothetical protein
MRPGLHLVVADAPPSRACNARVWLNPGSRGLVKRATLDVATRADARLAERHALLCHSENFESLVVMRLSPDWEMAVRRDDEDGGGRVVLRYVGDAAIVRPGDRVVRRGRPSYPSPLSLFSWFLFKRALLFSLPPRAGVRRRARGRSRAPGVDVRVPIRRRRQGDDPARRHLPGAAASADASDVIAEFRCVP